MFRRLKKRLFLFCIIVFVDYLKKIKNGEFNFIHEESSR